MQHLGFQAWILTEMSPRETRASDMLREYLPMNSKELASRRAVSSWPPKSLTIQLSIGSEHGQCFLVFWGGGYHSIHQIDLFHPDSDGLRYKSRVEFWFEVQLPASFSPLQFLLALLLPTSTTPLFYDPVYVQMNGRQVPGANVPWMTL